MVMIVTLILRLSYQLISQNGLRIVWVNKLWQNLNRRPYL